MIYRQEQVLLEANLNAKKREIADDLAQRRGMPSTTRPLSRDRLKFVQEKFQRIEKETKQKFFLHAHQDMGAYQVTNLHNKSLALTQSCEVKEKL